jgi:hypothetical protein
MLAMSSPENCREDRSHHQCDGKATVVLTRRDLLQRQCR